MSLEPERSTTIKQLGKEQISEIPNKENKIFTQEPPKKVSEYDIFLLAKWVLIVATAIYFILAIIRIFYSVDDAKEPGVKEVWDYSKVILNSIVSLVLGLYFGSNKIKSEKPV